MQDEQEVSDYYFNIWHPSLRLVLYYYVSWWMSQICMLQLFKTDLRVNFFSYGSENAFFKWICISSEILTYKN